MECGEVIIILNKVSSMASLRRGCKGMFEGGGRSQPARCLEASIPSRAKEDEGPKMGADLARVRKGKEAQRLPDRQAGRSGG